MIVGARGERYLLSHSVLTVTCCSVSTRCDSTILRKIYGYLERAFDECPGGYGGEGEHPEEESEFLPKIDYWVERALDRCPLRGYKAIETPPTTPPPEPESESESHPLLRDSDPDEVDREEVDLTHTQSTQPNLNPEQPVQPDMPPVTRSQSPADHLPEESRQRAGQPPKAPVSGHVGAGPSRVPVSRHEDQPMIKGSRHDHPSMESLPAAGPLQAPDCMPKGDVSLRESPYIDNRVTGLPEESPMHRPSGAAQPKRVRRESSDFSAELQAILKPSDPSQALRDSDAYRQLEELCSHLPQSDLDAATQ